MPLYAIGDIHGYLDKLQDILARIERDGGPDARVIFLGDYVDRGPDCQGVIDLFLKGQREGRDWRFVRGNHDRMFLKFLEESSLFDPCVISGKGWLHDRVGGAQTLASYLDPGDLGREIPGLKWLNIYGEPGKDMPADLLEPFFEYVHEFVPAEHLKFLQETKLFHEEPGYFFVHAGIRPGLPLHLQAEDDLLWIRHEFHNDQRNHGAFIVHGHTPVEAPDLRHNRLNLDTGAGHGNALTAAVFDEDGAIYALTETGRQRL